MLLVVVVGRQTWPLLPRHVGNFATVLAWLPAKYHPLMHAAAKLLPPTAAGPPIPASAAAQSASTTPSRQLLHVTVLPPSSILLPPISWQPATSSPPVS